MILDYTKNVYETASLGLLVGLINDLKSRGYILNVIRIEVQINLNREFIKLSSSDEVDEFLTFATDYIRGTNVVGDAVTIVRNIETVVGNISNEFITWNADFRVRVNNSFQPVFQEGKKQDQLRQEGIDIHVDRYKFLFLDFLNKYLEQIQSLIRQRELTAIDLNLSRYVDPFYVIDDQGVDNSYVFP